MHNLRRGLLAATSLILLVALVGTSRLAWAQGQQIVFSATGDIPYGTGEISVFQNQLDNHNKYSPSAFFVHVGDILSGGDPCNESQYSMVANMMKRLIVPAYIVPGDNETADCKAPAQGYNYFLQYYQNYEQNFCGAPSTERQSGRPENWVFTMDGVLFVGVNLVYGGTNAQQQAADWVKQQLEAQVAEVRAAVIFCHYTPGSSSTFSTPFRQAAADFGKPVLWLHGHGHAWSTGYPFPEQNIFRVQVDNGAAEDPVEVTVTMNTTSPATTFILKRKPWSSKTIVNMPPCADAGPDQNISETMVANLQGQATDDGDPNGSLTTTWSMASGPGTVVFGNIHALTTTASFSDNGVYVLLLTADDGQLQKSDEITIAVNSSGGSSAPIVSSFSPTSGTAGTVVTMTGSNFTDVAGVLFNGIPATSFTINSSTEIVATVPAGATTGYITITSSTSTGSSSTAFTVLQPLTIASFTPSSGPVTTEVTITGNGFSDATAVTFNSVNAVSFKVDSDTQIRATVPAGAATGKIGITNSVGSATSADDFTITVINDFSFAPTHDAYVKSSSPAKNYGKDPTLRVRVSSSEVMQSYLKFEVTGLNGAIASAKLRLYVSDKSPDGGAVYLTSNNYYSSMTPWLENGLNWNNAPSIAGAALSSVATVSAKKWVEFEVTAAIVGNGAYSFGLKNNNSDEVYYRSKEYAAANAPQLVIQTTPSNGPMITSFAPGNGPVDTEVTIIGNNFIGTTSVTFNGVPATTFTVDSNTKIRANVPAGATTGRIRITNADGSGAFGTDFIVMAPPVIASFTPASGPQGTEVIITGSFFIGTTSVNFNGQAATSIYVDSDTQLRAVIPTGATPGAGKIVVSNSLGSATGADDFTILPPPLVFTSQHDTYVKSSSPAKNYGTDTAFRVKVISSETFESYIKFEVTGLSGSVLSAKLRLYVSDAGPDGGAVYPVSNNYLNTATPWAETGLNWNNAPGISGSPLSSVGTVSTKQWVEFDVTSAITGDGIYSFGLKNNNADVVYYRSKEYGPATTPQLVIQMALGSTPLAKRENSTTATAAKAATVIPVPNDFMLEQNYPNPFPARGIFDNPITQIRFSLPSRLAGSHVTVKVYTINGAEVRTLVDAEYPAGTHAITFNAKNLPSGAYFYVMQAGNVRQVRRLMLVK